jgi:AcrR family transcriptional regulator
MGRRSDHSREQIRDMAVQAATRIVTRKGLAGLTARAIAGEIGYTVGTLYLAFENLDDLVLHINARTLDELHARIEQAGQDPGDPGQRLAAMSRAYIELARQQPRRWNAVFEHSLVDTAVPAWYQQRIDSLLLPVEQEFRALAPGQPEAEIRLAARTLWAGIHGISLAALTSTTVVRNPDTMWQMAQSLLDNYLAGFLRRQ